MSKASERAKTYIAPFSGERVCFSVADLHEPHLIVRLYLGGSGHSSTSMSAEEAVRAARWILDAFDEPVQICSRCALVLPRGDKRECPKGVGGNPCEPRDLMPSTVGRAGSDAVARDPQGDSGPMTEA